jgi:YidC/Oxa1 family membrane protein insertase
VQGGVKLVKTYTQRGAYDMPGEARRVVTAGSAPVSPQLYSAARAHGNKLPGDSPSIPPSPGRRSYTHEKKFHKVEFSDIDKNKAEIDKNADGGYIAMVQHYFASAWILPDGVKRENFVRKVSENLYAVGMITPLAGGARPAGRGERQVLFRSPRRKAAGAGRHRPGPGEGLRLADHPGQAAVLAAVQAAQASSATGAGRSWRWC